MTKNIGVKVNEPKRECDDKNCPFHGGLSIRGKLFDGKVTGDKAKQTITLTKDEPIYFSKFKRYARGKSTIHAHVPGCIDNIWRPCIDCRMQTNIKISVIRSN